MTRETSAENSQRSNAPVAAGKSGPAGGRRFTSRGRLTALFEKILETSIADETELVWFERQHGVAESGQPAQLEEPRLTVLLRVVEGGRLGWHRTEIADETLLENAVRHALAVATIQPRVPRRPLFPTDQSPHELDVPVHDEELQFLDPRTAERRLQQWCGNGVTGRFHWSRTRLAVFNSHGVRRHTTTTEASLEVKAGGGPGAGYAAASARSLAELHPEAVIERARLRRADGQIADAPSEPVSVVLSAEAVIELLDLINIFAFAGRAYLDGSSFLAQHRGVQVFDRTFHVRDDGARVPGMPLPFDLEGAIKRPIDLIVEGRPSTPALSRAQSGEAGLEPTGQSVGGEDAMFGNLFLLPGEQSEADLLRGADGGLFIGHLDRPACSEPRRLEIRGAARGVRRIEGGALGAAVPDLIWESSLLAVFARLAGIGRHPVVRAMPSTPLGGISAPALALADVSGFTPLG